MIAIHNKLLSGCELEMRFDIDKVVEDVSSSSVLGLIVFADFI